MKARVLRKAEWRASAEAPSPDVSFMPAMERRRLSQLQRAAINVSWRVFNDPSCAVADAPVPDIRSVPVVFASRWGEIGTTLKLIRQLHCEGEMSPAGFSASVHNAAPGAWSLFSRNTAPYTAVSARESTYEAWLLEAEAQLAAGLADAVLYVYAEEETPGHYRSGFKNPEQARAIAMLLAGGGESPS